MSGTETAPPFLAKGGLTTRLGWVGGAERRRGLAYALAVIITVPVVLVYVAVGFKVRGQVPLTVLMIPIILSAYVGGLGPGLLSTVLAAAGATLIYLSPAHVPWPGTVVEAARWLSLIAGGVLVSVLNEALYRSHLRVRQAEQALREREAQHRAIIETSPDGFCIIDEQGRFVDVNEAYLRRSGYSHEDLLGMRISDVEAREQPEEIAVHLEQIRRGSGALFETLHRAKDGTVWHAEVAVAYLPVAGGRFLSFIRDITARKQAEQHLREREERFRSYVESAPLAVLVAGRDGRFVDANPAALDLLGYDLAALAQMHVPDLLPEEDRAMVLGELATLAHRGQLAGEYRMRRQDGRLIWVLVRAVMTADGRSMAYCLDVTERKRSEEARAQLEARLHETQKMEALGTLAGGVAHDFNNILGTIIGNAELAAQDVGPGHPALQSLDEIRRAGLRAKEMVQRILAFAREGRQVRRVISLRPVVEDAVTLLRASLPAGVELTTSIAADTPTVLADATQVVQVLVHLCTNACQALEGGVGRVDIRVDGVKLDGGATAGRTHLPPGCWARLSVSDSGAGMDSATIERLFDPFFTTKPPGRGSGLGLSIVHRIVKAHGGTIDVRSQPQAGTAVAVYLPAAPAPEEHKAERAAAAPGAPAGSQHVLYLDDEAELTFLVTRALEARGYRVSGFTRADAALAAVRADPGQFDLVVTDLNMPGMSGLEVTREVTRLRPDLPVVLVSGYITEQLEAQAAQSGVRQLIYKPGTLEELCAVVQRHLEEAKRSEKDRNGNGTHSCDR